MKGLYSGRVIMARKASKGSLTRTQTAGQAYTAIVKKYGEISQSAKYMHKGSGNWVKYSIENDRKRTGKTTTDIKKWREAPHKLDFEGKDTKPVKSGKKVFSVAALKAPSKLAGRGKKPIKAKHTFTTKQIRVPDKLKNPMPYADRDSDGRYNFYAKFKTGNYGMLAKSKADFMRMANSRGYKENDLIELKVARPSNYGEPLKWIKFDLSIDKFSPTRLKQSGKPSGRTAKKLPNDARKAITKSISAPVKPKSKKRVNRDKLSVAERAPEVKAPTGPKPATFDLKSNPDRKEFVSDYTGITDHLQRRANRVAKIRADQDKGRYKNADTRRHEANHAKYMKRASKIRSSVKR